MSTSPAQNGNVLRVPAFAEYVNIFPSLKKLRGTQFKWQTTVGTTACTQSLVSALTLSFCLSHARTHTLAHKHAHTCPQTEHTKVHQFYSSLCGEQDVVAFDITVDGLVYMQVL